MPIHTPHHARGTGDKIYGNEPLKDRLFTFCWCSGSQMCPKLHQQGNSVGSFILVLLHRPLFILLLVQPIPIFASPLHIQQGTGSTRAGSRRPSNACKVLCGHGTSAQGRREGRGGRADRLEGDRPISRAKESFSISRGSPTPSLASGTTPPPASLALPPEPRNCQGDGKHQGWGTALQGRGWRGRKPALETAHQGSHRKDKLVVDANSCGPDTIPERPGQVGWRGAAAAQGDTVPCPQESAVTKKGGSQLCITSNVFARPLHWKLGALPAPSSSVSKHCWHFPAFHRNTLRTQTLHLLPLELYYSHQHRGRRNQPYRYFRDPHIFSNKFPFFRRRIEQESSQLHQAWHPKISICFTEQDLLYPI